MSAFDTLNPEIQEHLKLIGKDSGLGDADGLERLAAAWIEKRQLFEGLVEENRLTELAFFGRLEPRGALALTYSSSILTIGPVIDGVRRCEYSSIGLRTDVPPSAVEDESELAGDLEVDEIARFSKGPIKSSSQLFTIAVAREDLAPKDEEELLTKLGHTLAEGFAELNKTVLR